MFVKEPILGGVKTRLAKDTSDEFVLELYMNFVKDLLKTLKDFDFVLYSYPNVNFYENNDVYKQVGKTLGDKMFNAFDEQFEKGYDNIVLIGSDTPHLSCELLNESFEALKTKNIVIGPSLDGGYYLIAFNKKALQKNIFENISWSSDKVLEETLHKVNNKELYLLKYLNDIDTIDDLKTFYREYEKMFESSNTIQFLKGNFHEKL